MALHKKKAGFYGDSQNDIRESLLDYSRTNGYPAQHFADPVCVCGAAIFNLWMDENEGAAIRICTSCEHEHPIGDSEEYLEGGEFEQSECLCGSQDFELTVGVALYEKSDAVRWLYIGCRCLQCALTGCYGDWKNEFEDFRELMNRI